MTPREPVERLSVDAVADALRADILRGTIAVGEALRQETLAQRFGVSHIPVREALRQLAAEGLVSIRPNRGAMVASLSPDEATELLEIRCTLETQLVRWALPLADAGVHARAADSLDLSERTADVDRWMEHNWTFHSTLYERAGRPRMVSMIRTLNNQIDRFIRVLLSRSDYRYRAQEEHRAILAAYRLGNEVAVCSLLGQHLLDTSKQLAAVIEQGDAGLPPGGR
jgi:DNA-binding GntR family transcriptional regulator